MAENALETLEIASTRESDNTNFFIIILNRLSFLRDLLEEYGVAIVPLYGTARQSILPACRLFLHGFCLTMQRCAISVHQAHQL